MIEKLILFSLSPITISDAIPFRTFTLKKRNYVYRFDIFFLANRRLFNLLAASLFFFFGFSTNINAIKCSRIAPKWNAKLLRYADKNAILILYIYIYTVFSHVSPFRIRWITFIRINLCFELVHGQREKKTHQQLNSLYF